MPILSSDKWFLRKHEDKSVFGPVAFSKLVEWARGAQIAPQDAVSEDGINWNKAPMIPEMGMDWLVQTGEQSYYGPTTPNAIMEFYTLGEINQHTVVINCKTAKVFRLGEAEFFPSTADDPMESEGPGKGSLRSALQKRVRELEAELLEKQRALLFAEDKVRRLEKKLAELEQI